MGGLARIALSFLYWCNKATLTSDELMAPPLLSAYLTTTFLTCLSGYSAILLTCLCPESLPNHLSSILYTQSFSRLKLIPVMVDVFSRHVYASALAQYLSGHHIQSVDSSFSLSVSDRPRTLSNQYRHRRRQLRN